MQAEQQKALSSTRTPPCTHEGKRNELLKSKRANKRKADDEAVRHVAFKASTAPPNERILARLRSRVEQRRLEQGQCKQDQQTAEGSEECEGISVKGGTDADRNEARAKSIADEIRASKGVTRDYFRQVLQKRIDEQKHTKADQRAKCMQDKGIKKRMQGLQGRTDEGRRGASRGDDGCQLSSGESAGGNFTA